MKQSKLIVKGISIAVLLITISSVNAWSRFAIGNTFFWWIIYALIIFLFYKGKNIVGKVLSENGWPITFFLSLVLLSFIHGCIKAEYYWDWKLLFSNLLIFSMPVAIYTFSSPFILKRTLQVWFKYALILFPVFLLFILPEAYGRYLVPISVILLFFPILPLKWKIIGVVSILFIILTSADARSNVIKIIMPLLISQLYYFRKFVLRNNFRRMCMFLAILFFASPFVFLTLAITNTFNVFNMSEYLESFENSATIQKKGESVSLLDDTRTLIYEEEISSAIKNNYWLFGRSLARGYDTELFAEMYKEAQDDTNRKERQNSEVSILNVFNYFGLIGVASYFLIFLVAVYKSIYKAESIFMMLIGINISFRWFYAWVEDFNLFDLNYLFLWIMIGMCFSKPFKAMSNLEFNTWIKSIFNKSKIKRKATYNSPLYT